MTDTITLTRQEVREARKANLEVDGCLGFLYFKADICSPFEEFFAWCRLCKRLTEFAEGEEDEQK